MIHHGGIILCPVFIPLKPNSTKEAKHFICWSSSLSYPCSPVSSYPLLFWHNVPAAHPHCLEHLCCFNSPLKNRFLFSFYSADSVPVLFVHSPLDIFAQIPWSIVMFLFVCLFTVVCCRDWDGWICPVVTIPCTAVIRSKNLFTKIWIDYINYYKLINIIDRLTLIRYWCIYIYVSGYFFFSLFLYL